MTLFATDLSKTARPLLAVAVFALLAILVSGCTTHQNHLIPPGTAGTLTYNNRLGEKTTVFDLTGDWVFVDTGIGLDGALVRVKQRKNRVRGYWLYLDWPLIDTYWQDRPDNTCGPGDLLFIGEIEETTIIGKRFLCYPRFLSDPLVCSIIGQGRELEILMMGWDGMPHSARLKRRE